tara:strand:- start:218 stop:466 length:249 start_codon:yes stop_codon:yes gene_type:complete
MEGFKLVAANYRSNGVPCKLYVDISGPMDVVVMELEIDSLDGYFTDQRAFYTEMDEATKGLIGSLNGNTASGSRVLYEIVEY